MLTWLCTRSAIIVHSPARTQWLCMTMSHLHMQTHTWPITYVNNHVKMNVYTLRQYCVINVCVSLQKPAAVSIKLTWQIDFEISQVSPDTRITFVKVTFCLRQKAILVGPSVVKSHKKIFKVHIPSLVSSHQIIAEICPYFLFDVFTTDFNLFVTDKEFKKST